MKLVLFFILFAAQGAFAHVGSNSYYGINQSSNSWFMRAQLGLTEYRYVGNSDTATSFNLTVGKMLSTMFEAELGVSKADFVINDPSSMIGSLSWFDRDMDQYNVSLIGTFQPLLIHRFAMGIRGGLSYVRRNSDFSINTQGSQPIGTSSFDGVLGLKAELLITRDLSIVGIGDYYMNIVSSVDDNQNPYIQNIEDEDYYSLSLGLKYIF